MKKTAFVLFVLSLLLLISCTGEPETQNSVEIANPIKQVNAAADFEALGVYIEAPEGAENVSYSTISGFAAQIRFTLDENEYTFRAALSDEDISGVYAAFNDEAKSISACGEEKSVTIDVKTVKDNGGALASWRYGDGIFTLFSPTVNDLDQMGDLALALSYDLSDVR